MFRKLLVANRGEIAIRVMRACRDLGIETVALYGDDERDALHARYADEAFLLDSGDAARPYLNAPGMIALALRAGADAVHPGYGFLAENASFARAVVEAGLIWVGPPAEAIAALGDKIEARRIAGEAGVPLVPGSTRPVESAAAASRLGHEWGFPLALKAAGGGGGRGFRVARAPEDVAGAFEAVRREGQNFFNNPELYVEKYIEGPKHVEIQVLADMLGHAIHLGERECSVQRRHQKLIEEAPSPAVDAELRERMGSAAVALARSVGYTGAGTVEFLLDTERNFYFMEMNARIQVEHTVTEEVTGIDLVKAQLRIAAGGALDLTQDGVTWRGHAIECRINAEDPARGFTPTPGAIATYHEPAGPGVRIDGAAAMGTVISPAYDSMIAKLIVRGADRGEALARMRRALGEYRIGGVASTIPFHQLVLGHSTFVEGRVTTDWIERDRIGQELAPSGDVTPDTPPSAEPRQMTVEVNGKRFVVRLFDDGRLTESATKAGRNTPAKRGSVLAKRSGSASGDVASPIQGTVLRVAVENGASVAAGDLICAIEAMKMENEITAPRAGVVADLVVSVGQTVKIGDRLATIG